MAKKIRNKMENFLYYYKGSVIAGCLVITLLIYGSFSYITSEAEPIVYGEILNQTVAEEVIQVACDRGLRAMGRNSKRERILLETGLVIDVEHPEKNLTNGALEKMTSQIFSQELDFIIGPPEIMDYYAKLGGLYSLDDWMEEEKDEKVTLVKSQDKEGKRKYYGIDISKTLLGAKKGKTVFCILNNSEHKEETMIFLESLLK